MRFLSNLLASTLGALLALVVVFLIGFLFLLGLAASSDGSPSVPSDAVLDIRLDGPVPEHAADDPLRRVLGEGSGYDLRRFRKGLRMAAADDRIRAVHLQAEGTGAGWAQLQEMRAALQRYTASGKPLYATTSETGMTENDYFLASAADSVFAAPESVFEFNGFVLSSYFLKGALQKLGVKATAVRAGKYKSAVERYTRKQFSSPNERQLNAIVNTINSVFKKAVSRSRGVSTDSLEQIADHGTVFSAEDAVRVGLVDALVYSSAVDSLFARTLGYSNTDDVNTIDLTEYARTSSSDAGLSSDGDSEIAVVYGTGEIVSQERESLWGGGNFLTPDPFRKAMREAREDDDVKAVVLRVNSPGGQVAPSETMRHQVKMTTRQKPVIVSMSNLAASGGYWLSSPADSIVANPLTLTGSIGVFALFFNAQDFFNDKLGVTFDEVMTSSFADLGALNEPLSDGEKQLLQRHITDTYQSFVRHVAAGRGMTRERVDSLGQGHVWIGQDAKMHNLVDALGGLDTAVEMAATRVGLGANNYHVRALPKPKSFLERYLESLGNRSIALWQDWRLSAGEKALREKLPSLQRLRRIHEQPMALWPFALKVH